MSTLETKVQDMEQSVTFINTSYETQKNNMKTTNDGVKTKWKKYAMTLKKACKNVSSEKNALPTNF